MRWVYPRVCGGTKSIGWIRLTRQGLSPRVRGNQLILALLPHVTRSIPACAGEPTRNAKRPQVGAVYPRVCGGTTSRSRSSHSSKGLSPRVRGNPGQPGDHAIPERSIPACAGEPRSRRLKAAPRGVYPRVCGGTVRLTARLRGQSGLSPRVRGNRGAAGANRRRHGSIPACAGEPRPSAPGRCRPGVYPRVCGGTRRGDAKQMVTVGLSPRVRGNPASRPGSRTSQRSIPACAGEPKRKSGSPHSEWVYPRVCGGTAPTLYQDLKTKGLSPRVRGNPLRYLADKKKERSIPACAGEPPPSRRRRLHPTVYPRVCGGTPEVLIEAMANGGLSPRVRGNLTTSCPSAHRRGSIPACAGEPVPIAAQSVSSKVYPRVCGGTKPPGAAKRSRMGLSPRVRGNLGLRV